MRTYGIIYFMSQRTVGSYRIKILDDIYGAKRIYMIIEIFEPRFFKSINLT
jgi:hypothetical protein